MSWNSLINEYFELLKTRSDTTNLSQIFSKLSVDDKVSFTYDLLRCDDVLPTYFSKNGKCSFKATEYRNLGNQFFGRKKDVEALKYYTESVTFSPKKSESLALAYANRSAVLIRLGLYDLCLLDIHRALSNNYPESLRHKLFNRRKECLKLLQTHDNVNSLYLDIFSKLSLALNDETVPLLTVDDECSIIACKNKILLPQVNFSNQMIPGASEKMAIKWSSEMGRHLVAVEDIEPGEILTMEKAYASILLPEFYHTHCSYCFHRTEAPIPCDECSSIVFCNSKCYKLAMVTFHRVECEILPFLISLKLGKMELLAARILIIATEQGERIMDLYNHPIFRHPIVQRSITMDIYNSTDYFSVHYLEDNYSKRSVANLFRQSTDAAILLHVLKHSSFFKTANLKIDNVVPSDLTAIETYAGSLLLKYLLIVSSNAHEISELIETESSSHAAGVITENLEIGAALYPLLSLTNHSCDPNVVRHSYGDAVVFRSIQLITKSQQLFDNYGYHFALHSRDERQSHLKMQYFFDCNCDPCMYDWPTHVKLTSEDFEFTCKVNEDELKRYTQMYKDALAQSPTNLVIRERLNDLLKYLTLLHRSVRRPCKIYSGCQEIIKQILAYDANHYTLNNILI